MAITKSAVKKLKASFEGCIVVFYLKDMIVPIVSPDGENLEVNAMVDGLVVDIDQDFYYIGDPETGTIIKTIPHDVLGPVELAMEPQMDISFPETELEVH